MTVSPADAARELRKRSAARESMSAYIDYCDLGYVPAEHHKLLIGSLEDVERGECDRLMVCMPPGSGKSVYTSTIYPAWALARRPGISVIAASHTQELAERFGRRVRNLVGSAPHAMIAGGGLAPDSQAAGRWETAAGGEYYAAGVGGSITGRRADLAIIDDPVRSREDADSDRGRERAWEWYVSDLSTRLKPGAAQVVVMTRWHEDDLGGRILAREGSKWRVIELAMEALPGDPLGRKAGDRLWPEWYTDDMIETAKRDVRAWNALYQQQPATEDGDYFRAEWFPEYDRTPPGLTYYGASDYAVTDGAGDYTEHGIFAVDQMGNIYVIDWWRGQASADVWIERLCDLIGIYRPACWFGESGPIRRAVEPYMIRRMQERKTYCRLEWLASIHDKETRARSIQALASMGKVLVPRQAKWKADVLGQLLRFPAGRHDDSVDVFSLIGRGLEMVKPKRRTDGPKMQPWQPLDPTMGY